MGFARRGVWVMVCNFPAHQVGGLVELWDITGYGFSQVWVMTGSTVLRNGRLTPRKSTRIIDCPDPC